VYFSRKYSAENSRCRTNIIFKDNMNFFRLGVISRKFTAPSAEFFG
jgi:hypothetical protein